MYKRVPQSRGNDAKRAGIAQKRLGSESFGIPKLFQRALIVKESDVIDLCRKSVESSATVMIDPNRKWVI
jgi:hypothetical protein